MPKEIFEIEKPTSDLNAITLVFKYVVLFIVLFLGTWTIMLLSYSRKATKDRSMVPYIFDHPVETSVFISFLVLAWFIYRARRKYLLGEVFSLEFNDTEEQLMVKTVNLVNNQVKQKSYNYCNLSYSFKHAIDDIFGRQRILNIFENGTPVHTINIDRTGWCRHEQLEALLARFNAEHFTNPPPNYRK